MLDQTLTYNRKALITSFEKATEITQSVKIDSIVEAQQIINYLLFHLKLKQIKRVIETYITPDFNKDTIKIQFFATNINSEDEFIQELKVFNDFILKSNA